MPHHRHLAAVDPAYPPIRREIEAFSMLARRAPRTTVARITAVVHVLYRTEAENISDEQVRSQIDVLNADFRARNADVGKVPAPFAGRSAMRWSSSPWPPSTRKETRPAASRGPARAPRVQRRDRRPRRSGESGAIALASRPLPEPLGVQPRGGLLGYAQFPGGPAIADGVVILNTAFGTTGIVEEPFHRGRTATHEVGHWLNLLHIWGDDDLGCRGSDSVSDTPNQAGSNGGCPRSRRCRAGTAPTATCS